MRGKKALIAVAVPFFSLATLELSREITRAGFDHSSARFNPAYSDEYRSRCGAKFKSIYDRNCHKSEGGSRGKPRRLRPSAASARAGGRKQERALDVRSAGDSPQLTTLGDAGVAGAARELTRRDGANRARSGNVCAHRPGFLAMRYRPLLAHSIHASVYQRSFRPATMTDCGAATPPPDRNR